MVPRAEESFGGAGVSISPSPSVLRVVATWHHGLDKMKRYDTAQGLSRFRPSLSFFFSFAFSMLAIGHNVLMVWMYGCMDRRG